jgi:integrase
MKSRHVRLPDRLVDRVKRMVNGRNVGYLFEDKGRQLTEHRLRKAIIRYREVVEKYGLNEARKVHLHTFRHFYATKVYNETKDLVLVKTLLGHSSVRTTEVYTHIMQFDDNRCEAKAIPVENVEEVCKLLEKGWKIEASTKEHLFMKHHLLC